MAKEFTFRGKTLGELSGISYEEFMKLVPSRERRNMKRAKPNKKLKLKMERARKTIQAGKYPKPIRTHLREMVVTPDMIGLNFAIHKGNGFETVEIRPKMLGYRFGELALTRKRLKHGKAGIGATKSSTAITARG